MKIEYLGYLVEPAASFDADAQGWRARVTIWRQDSGRSQVYDAFGVHASEATGRTAALMYAQDLILNHQNRASGQLTELDMTLAETKAPAAGRRRPNHMEGGQLWTYAQDTGDQSKTEG